MGSRGETVPQGREGRAPVEEAAREPTPRGGPGAQHGSHMTRTASELCKANETSLDAATPEAGVPCEAKMGKCGS